MSCINLLGNLVSHVSHGLVVRVLASGAGDPGSNPGEVIYGIEEEGLWKLWVMHGVTKLCGHHKISLIYLLSKMSFKFIKISKSIC
jgi:hypothetical protein